jgi:pyruvate/2-oxoglutarate/acetoin dehydrogenase E1 component
MFRYGTILATCGSEHSFCPSAVLSLGSLPGLHIIKSWCPQCMDMLLLSSVRMQQLVLFLPATAARDGLKERSGTKR